MVVRGSGTQGDLCVSENGLISVYVLDGTSLYGYLYDEAFNLVNSFTTNITDADDNQFTVVCTTISNEAVWLVTYLSSGTVITKKSLDGKTFS